MSTAMSWAARQSVDVVATGPYTAEPEETGQARWPYQPGTLARRPCLLWLRILRPQAAAEFG
jgi:hypothetical protein